MRGEAHYAKGDYDGAIADFSEAIRLDPKFAIAFSGRGLAYSAKGDHDRAIADFNEAIRLDPKSRIAFYNRGLAYDAKGDYDRAIADYTEAIRLDPKFAAAFDPHCHHRGPQSLSFVPDPTATTPSILNREINSEPPIVLFLSDPQFGVHRQGVPCLTSCPKR
jgi:tetratricopeptide (TPR) repeat protein